MTEKKVLFILADGFEEIEALGPIDILKRADINVTIAGLSGREITGGHGILITADKALDELYSAMEISEEFDCLVLPGGSIGAENLSGSDKVRTLIKKMHNKKKLIASICASPAVVLAPTGVLNGKKATCYPGMEKEFPTNVKYTDEKIVIDANLVTSKGPGTALLFGIKIVELLRGRDVAESVKRKMLI